jgi:hypothetical protein
VKGGGGGAYWKAERSGRIVPQDQSKKKTRIVPQEQSQKKEKE